MSALESPDPRLAELGRINSELAAELRRCKLSGEAAPHTGVLPAARRLAALIAERDSLLERSTAAEAELGAMKAEWDRLVANNRELAAEVERLRGGRRGLARRAWARLLAPRP